jgi:hypothetical protein
MPVGLDVVADQSNGSATALQDNEMPVGVDQDNYTVLRATGNDLQDNEMPVGVDHTVTRHLNSGIEHCKIMKCQ